MFKIYVLYIYLYIYIYIFVFFTYRSSTATYYLLTNSSMWRQPFLRRLWARSVYPWTMSLHHGFLFKVKGKLQFRRWCNLDGISFKSFKALCCCFFSKGYWYCNSRQNLLSKKIKILKILKVERTKIEPWRPNHSCFNTVLPSMEISKYLELLNLQLLYWILRSVLCLNYCNGFYLVHNSNASTKMFFFGNFHLFR